MNGKHISILIPDECSNSLGYYVSRCLKEANSKFKVYVFTSSHQISRNIPWLSFYQSSRYIDRLVVSEKPIGSLDYATEIIDFIKDENIDIVFAASEIGFKFVSKFRNELASVCAVIALPNDIALETAFNKWQLSVLLKQNDILTPETRLLASQHKQCFIGSVLIKPIDGCGGKDIRKFPQVEAIDLENYPSINRGNYIVQEYIEGYDIDCNVLCDRGNIIAHTVQQPLGVESGFSPKIDKLKFVHDERVFELAQKTMRHLEWNGVAHLDLRYCTRTGKLYVIEINPRFWQSLMGSLAAGVNFPYLLYLLSTNTSFEAVDYQDKYYAKFSRSIKDALQGSLNYSFSDTNIKYFLTDIAATIRLYLHLLSRSKV